MDKNKFTVCIRSSGEFTTDRLHKDIVRQIGSNEKVYLIKNLMFHQAVDKSFELALKNESLWLITLDADLIIKPNFLSTYIKVANSMKSKEIEAHAMTFDRLFMEYRSAGNRLYRVSSLPFLREILKKTKNNKFRPEGSMLKEAEKSGYKLKPIQDVVALHDFFQFSHDLFRKGYTCSFKHIDYSNHLLSNWKKMSVDSVDFSILLRGFAFGLADSHQFQHDAQSKFFLRSCKEQLKDFSNYNNSLKIPENLESYISNIKSNKFFSNGKPGMVKKITNILRRRFFEKN